MACPGRSRLRAGVLALLLIGIGGGGGGGCGGDDVGLGPGTSREGCGEPGSHSVLVGMHSCACEDGYSWCDEGLEAFECCPIEGGETGETGTEDGGAPTAPDEPCSEDMLEQLSCVLDPEDPSPAAGVVWACNGERWVEVPGYATFACLAEGKEFAYGCVPGPAFLCGYGPGSPCVAEAFGGICVDEDIIDTCVWGRRSVDRCSRLCGELEAFGPGFSTGTCAQPLDMPAICACE